MKKDIRIFLEHILESINLFKINLFNKKRKLIIPSIP